MNKNNKDKQIIDENSIEVPQIPLPSEIKGKKQKSGEKESLTVESFSIKKILE